MTDVTSHITSDPRVAHGKPVFKGTRIMVYLVLEMLAAGESTAAIINAYPALTKAHVAAALQFAAQTPDVRASVVDLGHAAAR